MRHLRNLDFKKDRDLAMKGGTDVARGGPQAEMEFAAWIEELRVTRPRVAASSDKAIRKG